MSAKDKKTPSPAAEAAAMAAADPAPRKPEDVALELFTTAAIPPASKKALAELRGAKGPSAADQYNRKVQENLLRMHQHDRRILERLTGELQAQGTTGGSMSFHSEELALAAFEVIVTHGYHVYYSWYPKKCNCQFEYCDIPRQVKGFNFEKVFEAGQRAL